MIANPRRLAIPPGTLIAGLCVFAMLAYALAGAGPYGLRVLIIAGVYALNVVGYQFIFGHAGALSLAQGTFFGIGAYTSGLLSLHLGAEFIATFPAAIIAAALLALLIAAPVLRLETHYLALATLGVSQVALLVAINWEAITGGANGLPNIPGIVLFGSVLGRGLPTFIAVWTCVGAGVAVAALILSPRRRLVLHLQRARPLAAAAVGIDRDRLRLAALLLSAAYGGAAGALYVHTTRVVSPDALAFSILVMTLAMTVIGGQLSLAGALIAALLLTHIPEWFRFLDQYYLLAYGAVMLAMVVFAPNGLSALIDRATGFRPGAMDPGANATPHHVRAVPTARGSALSTTGLHKRFGGVVAVDIGQLEIPAGQICGVIGPNGSGKTTLLNLISGFERADTGAIAAFGIDLTAERPHARARHGVARCFQQPMLLDQRSVLDNVLAAAMSSADVPTQTLLAQCGLDGTAEKLAGSLPFGQRRLVEVARALAGRPRLVLLDEPAAGLAEHERDQLAALVAMTRDAGMTWLIVDHNVAFLAALTDRLICLDRGRVIADGAPDKVLRDPDVARVYFGMVDTDGPGR